MKNKSRQYGSFEHKRKNFFQRKYLVIVMLVFISSIGLYYGLKQRAAKQALLNEIGTADEQTPAWWLQKYFGASTCTSDSCKPEADPDKDKLTNAQEFYYHSHPLNPHTIGDTLNDGQLVAQGFDPSRPGKMTFDEVVSDDNLLYESIVYEEDIKKMVNESQDISKIKLQLPLDADLKVIAEDNPESFKKYFNDMESNVAKYFPKANMENLKTVIKSGDADQVENIKSSTKDLVEELKNMPVPARLVTFHKYNIAFYILLGDVLPGPQMDNQASIDHWYDTAQSFLAVQQRLDLEKQVLMKEAAK
jgi:hypothetical protein